MKCSRNKRSSSGLREVEIDFRVNPTVQPGFKVKGYRVQGLGVKGFWDSGI